MKFKYTLPPLSIAALAAALTGCGPTQSATNTKTANLVYNNWAEGVAYTHLAQAVLEDKMGYEVELTAADVVPGYMAIAQGSHDAVMECWRELQLDYLARFSGKIKSLGNVYEGTRIGLAVPSYVTIDTIAELNEYADKFQGRITGIDAGAGTMQKIENELMPAYGLDNLTLMSSSGPAMTAALSDAIKHKEWIVFPAWKPHWMFGRWDLKFLKQDDDKIMWQTGNIEIIGRIDLEQDKPELAQFLKNFYLTDAELSDLILKVKDSDEDVLPVARQWMNDHPDVVSKWIPAAQ